MPQRYATQQCALCSCRCNKRHPVRWSSRTTSWSSTKNQHHEGSVIVLLHGFRILHWAVLASSTFGPQSRLFITSLSTNWSVWSFSCTHTHSVLVALSIFNDFDIGSGNEHVAFCKLSAWSMSTSASFPSASCSHCKSTGAFPLLVALEEPWLEQSQYADDECNPSHVSSGAETGNSVQRVLVNASSPAALQASSSTSSTHLAVASMRLSQQI